MKKFISLAIVVMMTLLVGCSNSSNNSSEYVAPTEANESSEYERVTEAPTIGNNTEQTTEERSELQDEYVLETYSNDVTFDGGYSYKATLKIGSWVKASDTDSIDNIWHQIGGTDRVPDISNFAAYNGAPLGLWSETTCIMAFGTLSVEDTTQGEFTIADGNKTIFYAIGTYELLHLGHDSYIQYSNGGIYQHSYSTGTLGSHGFIDIQIRMSGESWGPVPFVVCINNALSPDYPDGNPEIIDATWEFGDNEFKVNPIWNV